MVSKKDNFEKITVCKNCGSANIDQYCSNCGQKIYIKRFTLKNFFFVFLDAFNIEKGFLFTMKMLFLKPGVIINEYISGKTKKYFNPLKYTIIVAGLYAFLMVSTNFIDTTYNVANDTIYNSNEVLKEKYEEVKKDETQIKMEEKFFTFFKKYMNIMPLLIIPFYSLVTKWLYRSRKLFYGEFLVVNLFIFAQTFIIISLLIIPLGLIFPKLVNYFPIITFGSTLIYLCYALYKTFRSSPIVAVIKAFLIYVIGTLFFMLFMLICLVIFGIVISLLGFSLNDLAR